MNRRALFSLIPGAIAACATPVLAKGSWSIFPDWRQNRHGPIVIPEYKGCTLWHANGDPNHRIICRGEPHPGLTPIYDPTLAEWENLKSVVDGRPWERFSGHFICPKT